MHIISIHNDVGNSNREIERMKINFTVLRFSFPVGNLTTEENTSHFDCLQVNMSVKDVMVKL